VQRLTLIWLAIEIGGAISSEQLQLAHRGLLPRSV